MMYYYIITALRMHRVGLGAESTSYPVGASCYLLSVAEIGDNANPDCLATWIPW